jgi:hypothetical protein
MKDKAKKKVVKHLKSDIKNFKHEAKEDKDLIKSLKHKKAAVKKHEMHESKKHDMHEKKKVVAKKKAAKHKETPREKAKVTKVMREYKNDELHSGSKKGPKVINRKQAIAIALSEAKLSKKKHKPAKKKKK